MMKRICLLIALLGAAISIAATATAPFTTAAAQAQAPAPRRIVITAKRFTYMPGEITLTEGQPVVLVLRSADVAHGLRLRELSIDLKVPAGGTEELRFTPDKTGNFTGHCSVFCGWRHGSMKLQLHVVK